MSGKTRIGADEVLAALQRHPRVSYQSLVAGETEIAELSSTLPELVPFGDSTYAGILPVMDWDHRLPSRNVVLRIYAYYSPSTFKAGRIELLSRRQQIEERDLFPEFDVPDLAGLTADEAYEAEVDARGTVAKIRLISGWRRSIESDLSRRAVKAVRRSEDFRRVKTMSPARRSPQLGDLEAMNWTPPCESGFERWTIDVWYLLEIGPTVGKGRSFLVDPEDMKLISVREFVVHPR